MKGNYRFYQQFSEFLDEVSEFHGDLICDALGHYFMDPASWACPEDGVAALQMLTVCELHGFNSFLEKYDPVNNHEVSNIAFQLGLTDWFKDLSAAPREEVQE